MKVGSIRAWDAGVTWREIEKTPGVFDFSRLDAMVDTAEQHHADVLLVLGQTPAFHAKDPSAVSFYGDGAASPPDPKAWKTYVRKVAKRYAGRPVKLQVWNEGNVPGFWSGTPQQLADLTKATFDAIANVTPRPTLVSPALVTRLGPQRTWIDRFYGTSVDGKPVADYVDVVSLQLYPLAKEDVAASMTLLAGMKAVLKRHDVDKPIWNTEINYGLTGRPADPASRADQIMNVASTYLLNAANGVQRVYWYGWDQQSIVNTLLVEPDLATETPAGKAFEALGRWMTGATVSGCKLDGGTYACTLARPSGSGTVYWNPSGAGSVTVPDGATSAQKLGKKPQTVTAASPLSVGKVPVLVTAP